MSTVDRPRLWYASIARQPDGKFVGAAFTRAEDWPRAIAKIRTLLADGEFDIVGVPVPEEHAPDIHERLHDRVLSLEDLYRLPGAEQGIAHLAGRDGQLPEIEIVRPPRSSVQ